MPRYPDDDNSNFKFYIIINMEKLTYYQICNLINQGRKDEIPSGYNIVFATPEPHTVFDVELPGERIIVKDSDFPKPIKAYVSGKYEVIIPVAICSNIVIDFGTVVLHTRFSLSKLKFEYEHQYDILSWMNRKYPCIGLIKKSDCAFNTTLIIGDTTLIKINVFNALPIAGPNKDNIVDLYYDWVEAI